MVQWKMANYWKGNDPIGDTPIFDFHDYGRKCIHHVSKCLKSSSVTGTDWIHYGCIHHQTISTSQLAAAEKTGQTGTNKKKPMYLLPQKNSMAGNGKTSLIFRRCIFKIVGRHYRCFVNGPCFHKIRWGQTHWVFGRLWTFTWLLQGLEHGNHGDGFHPYIYISLGTSWVIALFPNSSFELILGFYM